jgi:hypothetical protein
MHMPGGGGGGRGAPHIFPKIFYKFGRRDEIKHKKVLLFLLIQKKQQKRRYPGSIKRCNKK